MADSASQKDNQKKIYITILILIIAALIATMLWTVYALDEIYTLQKVDNQYQLFHPNGKYYKTISELPQETKTHFDLPDSAILNYNGYLYLNRNPLTYPAIELKSSHSDPDYVSYQVDLSAIGRSSETILHHKVPRDSNSADKIAPPDCTNEIVWEHLPGTSPEDGYPKCATY